MLLSKSQFPNISITRHRGKLERFNNIVQPIYLLYDASLVAVFGLLQKLRVNDFLREALGPFTNLYDLADVRLKSG